MKAMAMHLLVALVWLFLSGNTTLGGFIMGMLAGFVLLATFKRALKCETYVRRVRGCVIFVLYFILDVFKTNFELACLTLSKGASSTKGKFLSYDVSDLNRFETLILAQCLSMTPGTMVAELTDDAKLILHAFPATSEEALKVQIDTTLKRHLLAFTR